MAGKSLQPSHEPPRRREDWRTHHTAILVYTVKTGEGVGGGETTRNYIQTQNGSTTNMGDTSTCGQQKTADCSGFTNVGLKHALAQVHK